MSVEKNQFSLIVSFGLQALISEKKYIYNEIFTYKPGDKRIFCEWTGACRSA